MTILKFIIGLLTLAGLSMALTAYLPSTWAAGYTLPMVGIHVSWAVTLLLACALFIVTRVKVG